MTINVKFLQTALLLSFLFLGICSCNINKEIKIEQPNIVYILADDLGYGDVSSFNPLSKIQTPFIDELASAGIRFTDAHSPSAVCTPTRYGILTGQYCWRSKLPLGVLNGYGRSLIEKEQTTVASFLKSNGYKTGVVGKWHLGVNWIIKEEFKDSINSTNANINEQGMIKNMNSDWLDFSQKPSDGPLNHGFDYSFILPASLDMEPYCYLENDVLTAIPDEYTPGNDLETGFTGAFWRKGRIAKGFKFEEVLPTFIQKAEKFITENSGSDKPFFLYVPFAAPHTPWVPKDEFKGLSEAGQYGDFVQMVDNAVGQILKAIDESGEAENTIVVFTSDNGPFWRPDYIEKFNHRAASVYRGMKADAWEGGHRIPFVVRWPGKIEAGSASDKTITHTNLLATCADLLKVELGENEGEDSHSILPLLLGNTKEYILPEALIQQSSGGYFVVRKGDWKLIVGRGSGGFSEPRKYKPAAGEAVGQLYNLKDDPSETNNLYLQQTEKVKQLNAILQKFKSSGRSR
jgi:arylsulfatase A